MQVVGLEGHSVAANFTSVQVNPQYTLD